MSNSSKHSLKGKSFRGQDLSGRDFSYRDIRGADFTNAILNGANFSHTKAGQRGSWIAFIAIVGLTVSAIAGLISGYSGGLVGLLLFGDIQLDSLLARLAGIVLLAALATFVLLIVKQGLGKAVSYFVITLILLVATLVTRGTTGIAVASIIPTFALLSAIAATIIWSLALTTVWIVAGRVVGILICIIAILCSLFGALEGTAPESSSIEIAFEVSRVTSLYIASTIITTIFILSIYVSWQVYSSNTKFSVLITIVNTLSSLGGTSFRRADLTDADFSNANLRGADFRLSGITRTCWFQARGFEQARTKGTYLENLQIRRLLVQKNAQDEDLSYCDLRRVNLKDANLQKTNFIGADLSEATLQNANLSGAKLAKSRLYQTNLSGSCLTGAVIQDWAISTDTKIDEVQCEFIYMKLPTEDDPDPWRKPDNRRETFKKGDFADFIAPIVKTLDLYRQQNVDPRQLANRLKSLDFYHYGGIDPSAAAIALNQLAEENPEAELEVVALEGRGSEKVRLQAVVTDVVDSSKLNAKYFEKYHKISSLPYSDIQALLAGVAEKDERIHNLEKLLENALQQPKFYVETYQNQGGFIMSQSKGNVNISGVQGNISGIAAAGEDQTMTGVAIGAISGSVTNTINQLPASPNPDNPGIKELLAQLQAAIEAESELPDEDKAEALEQVKTLAEAGQKPEDNALQKAAKTSMKILKGTAASLPDAAKLAEACTKLLPAIATLLVLV